MTPGQASITDFFTPKGLDGPLKSEVRRDDNSMENPTKAKSGESCKRPCVGALAVKGSKKLKSDTSVSAAGKYKFTKDWQSTRPISEDLEKKKLHERFVAILKQKGGLQGIRRRLATDTQEDVADSEEDEEPRGSKGGSKRLTSFEEQYIEIKRKYMDTILIVENGYKYKFYGQDARIASRICGWMFIPGKMTIDGSDPNDSLYKRFATCSFPVNPRLLAVRVRQLVDAGHKVGVVSQMETAAIKRAEKGRKSKLFTREVTSIHTKGTLLDDFGSENSGQLGATSGYLMALYETAGKGPGDDRTFSVVAVQTSTGDLIYDHFTDSPLLIELETRLLHIQPCEIICIGSISTETRRLLSHLKSKGSSIRLEEVEILSEDDASASLADHYARRIRDGSEQISPQIMGVVDAFVQGVKVCFVALVQYLTPFKLEHVLDLVGNFSPFGSRSQMVLNGNTLMSLEIFQNQTDHKGTGTLFEVLDNTRTQFGRRLLSKWVANPLIDREALECRLDAVTELFTGYNSTIESVMNVMARTPDLENGLVRVRYKRCDGKQLYYLLYYLHKFSTCVDRANLNFRSTILQELFSSLPSSSKLLSGLLSQISAEDAKQNNKENYFILNESAAHEDVADLKMMIEETKKKLQKLLVDTKRDTAIQSLRYVSVAGDDYLFEMTASDSKRVPRDWIKESATKSVLRFTSAALRGLKDELELNKEKLAVACDHAFSLFLDEVGRHYEQLRRMVVALANIDCLASLAAVSGAPGYVRPTFVDTQRIDIKQGRHPVVELLLKRAYVPNDTRMSSDSDRALIVTGPNMGGKSSYVRQTALICIMAQIGAYVPAERADLCILDAVFTRMGAYDNMLAGESTFMVELNECRHIMKTATDKSLVLLDEIGRGTSTLDGLAIAYAVLSYFIVDIRSLTLFVTHYPTLANFESTYPGLVGNIHMGFIEQETDLGKRVTFMYTAARGVALRSYGLNVARLAGIPEDIILKATEKSLQLEDRLTYKRQLVQVTKIITALKQISKGNIDSGDAAALIEDMRLYALV